MAAIKMNLKMTLIKLSTIIGLPYLLARSSKCNPVDSYVGSYLCTEVKKKTLTLCT